MSPQPSEEVRSQNPVPPSSTTETFDLMGLPAEMRLHLYKQIFRSTTLIVHNNHQSRNSKGRLHRICAHKPASGINILLTNKQVNAEARQFLFPETEFVLKDWCPCWHYPLSKTPINVIRKLTHERYAAKAIPFMLTPFPLPAASNFPLLTASNFPKLQRLCLTRPFLGADRVHNLNTFIVLALSMAKYIEFEMVASDMDDTNSTPSDQRIVRVEVVNSQAEVREVFLTGYFNRTVQDVFEQLRDTGLLTPGTVCTLRNTFYRNAATKLITI